MWFRKSFGWFHEIFLVFRETSIWFHEAYYIVSWKRWMDSLRLLYSFARPLDGFARPLDRFTRPFHGLRDFFWGFTIMLDGFARLLDVFTRIYVREFRVSWNSSELSLSILNVFASLIVSWVAFLGLISPLTSLFFTVELVTCNL